MKTVLILFGLSLIVTLPVSQVGGQSSAGVPITPENARHLTPMRLMGFGAVYGVTWSPDGMLLAVASEAGVHLIPFEENSLNRLAAQFLDHNLIPVRSASFSPDGSRLATAVSDGTVRIWDIEQQPAAPLVTLGGHSQLVYQVAFSPDGKWLASADADAVRLWDASTYELRLSLPGHSTVAFSPDGGSVAAASEGDNSPGNYDQAVRLWDITTGKEIGVLRGQTGIVRSVAFSSDGTRLAAGGDGGRGWVWSVTENDSTGWPLEALPRGTFEGEHVINNISFDATGTRLTGSIVIPQNNRFGKIGVWQADSGRLESNVEFFESVTDQQVNCVDFHPAQDVLAVGTLSGLVLWDVSNGQKTASVRNQVGIWSLAFSPDGTWLAGSDRINVLRLWDTSTGLQIGEWPAQHGRPQFSPDGSRLALKDADHVLHLWSLARDAQGITAYEFAAFTDRTAQDSITFTRRGELAIFDGEAVLLIDPLTGNVVRQLEVEGATIVGLADTSLGLVGLTWTGFETEQQQAGLTFLETDLPALDLGRYDGPVYTVSFSPDSQWFAMSGWEDVYLWRRDISTEPLLLTSLMPQAEIFSLVYTPDSRILASGSAHEVTLWNVQQGTVLEIPFNDLAGKRTFWGAAFSPDGVWLTTGGHTTWLWAIAADD